ncbi:MAG: type II secretion system F family protein [Phycisphaeraceae bacterium]|nr:type II secretion system F family protein [Phycisphaeraceae bacterium]
MDNVGEFIGISILLFVSVAMLVRFGWPVLRQLLARQERMFDSVLNHDLLLEIEPRLAVALWAGIIVASSVIVGYIVGGILWFIIGAILGMMIPNVTIHYLAEKRRTRLDEQLVGGVTTLASGVRAGLNLIQAMELLVQNSVGPIRQEFAQLLREYQMGLDLNRAMRNTANRIGSSNYRLLFTALEMHRIRGGDSGESLDRIADSVREIQRLEGKLDALTAQGRMQARFMIVVLLAIVGMLYAIEPDNFVLLFTEQSGRIVLVLIVALLVTAFAWIRRIMEVDI